MKKEMMDSIKVLLNNSFLLKWVKKFSADGLKENNEITKEFEIKTTKESVSIMDVGQVKMLITQASYTGKTHVMLGLSHIKEVLSLLEKEELETGKLVIPEKKDFPCLIQTENNVVVIAPKVDTEDDEEEEDLPAEKGEGTPVAKREDEKASKEKSEE